MTPSSAAELDLGRFKLLLASTGAPELDGLEQLSDADECARCVVEWLCCDDCGAAVSAAEEEKEASFWC